jgi:TPR repeat protein
MERQNIMKDRTRPLVKVVGLALCMFPVFAVAAATHLTLGAKSVGAVSSASAPAPRATASLAHVVYDTDNPFGCSPKGELLERYRSTLATVSGSGEGQPQAAYDLAGIFERSSGPNCQPDAFQLYQRASDAGYGPAHAKLANAYRKGKGVKPDFERAAYYYLKAARLGYANAAYRLIEMTEKGAGGVVGDVSLASVYVIEFLPLIEDRIRQGDRVAARSLARLYERSKSVDRDLEKAIGLYRYASGLGDAIAMHDLALLLGKQFSDMSALGEQISLLEEGARLGYPAAFTALGRMHLDRDTGLDPKAAVDWFERGTAAGHAGSMHELALLQLEGVHVPRDVERARELAERGARLRHAGSRKMLDEFDTLSVSLDEE